MLKESVKHVGNGTGDHTMLHMIARRVGCFSLMTAMFMAAYEGAVVGQDVGGYGDSLQALAVRAKASGDTDAERRVINLREGLRQLKPSDFDGVRCGNTPKDTVNMNIDKAEDIAGKLSEKALQKYLPTLAAALASASTAGVTTFLTPQVIGSDSVEVLNNSERHSRADVQNAARQVLQATLPDTFAKLPKPMMARVIACAS